MGHRVNPGEDLEWSNEFCVLDALEVVFLDLKIIRLYWELSYYGILS